MPTHPLRIVSALLPALLLGAWAPASPAAGQALETLQRAPEARPAVSVPIYQIGDQEISPGTAFFLAIDEEPGAVAVTTAHAMELPKIAAAGEVLFQLGYNKILAGASNRFYVTPGTPYEDRLGPMRNDYLVYALDHELLVARALEADRAPPESLENLRVTLIGIPAHIPQDQDDIFGKVINADAERIEVQLDVPYDLRGWGGAPVLRYPEGTVIGFLQAAWPHAGAYRLAVAPIGGVLDALRVPARGGLGIDLVDYREGEGAPADGASVASEVYGGTDAGSVAAAGALEGPAGRRIDDVPLLGRAGALETNLVLEIEYPPQDSYLGDPEGAFVAGRAMALLGEFKRFDVVMVIDTSSSTAQMTQVDLDGDGVVGESRFGGLFGYTDSGDSILAAEIAAARKVLSRLDPRSTRVAVVTFAGEPPREDGSIRGSTGYPRADARTEQALTDDYELVEKALQRIWRRRASGMTNMTEGLRLAIRELRGFRGAFSQPDPDSDKVIMFFTDGTPTLPFHGSINNNVRSVMRTASQALRADIRVHSFAIGPEALQRPTAAVEMARITGGLFTPVRRPGDLVSIVENVSFANIESLSVRNATLDEPAFAFSSAADGSFAALTPLTTGPNILSVRVKADDGTELVREVRVNYAPGLPSPTLSRELMAKRNRLLEERLITLRRERVEAERERAEQVRRELAIEIERERAKAEARADSRRLEIGIEEVPEAEATDDAEGEDGQ